MKCRDFDAFLMAYLDGELPAEENHRFEDHMSECPECVNYLDSYRSAVALGRCVCEDPEGPVPEDVPEGLIRAILAARGGSGESRDP